MRHSLNACGSINNLAGIADQNPGCCNGHSMSQFSCLEECYMVGTLVAFFSVMDNKKFISIV